MSERNKMWKARWDWMCQYIDEHEPEELDSFFEKLKMFFTKVQEEIERGKKYEESLKEQEGERLVLNVDWQEKVLKGEIPPFYESPYKKAKTAKE